MVSSLVEKQSIREMGQEERGFFSRAFLVPKRNGGYRLVIDLSELNNYLSDVTFQMDTLTRVTWVTSDSCHWYCPSANFLPFAVPPAGCR